uniref:HMG box domain-containing protein n=1 Tax=Esox lucius TaxID=8010 RepID=A0A3P8XB10_ESOLU
MDSTEDGQMEAMDEDQAWGREDLKKLLDGIKENISKAIITSVYTKGERMLAWDKVAFHPYSPEMCQKKWKELSQKIRKIRSLAELVAEAECALENPFQCQNAKIHPDIPKRPTPPNSIFSKENFKTFKNKHPEMTNSELFALIRKAYTELPEPEKAKYMEKFHKEQKIYEKAKSRLSNEYSGVKQVQRDRLKKGKGPLTPQGLWYRHERKMFLQANPDEDPGSEGSPKSQRKPVLRKSERLLMDLADGKPDKPPWNGYNLFCKEQKSVIQGKGIPADQYMVVCSQQWKTLTLSEKENYQRRCNKLKKEFEVNMNRYLCSLSEKEQQRLLVDYRKSMQSSTLATQRGRKRKLERKSSKPSDLPPSKFVAKKGGERALTDKPSLNGYTVFCSEKLAELRARSSHLSTENILKLVSRLWKKLAKKEKDRYHSMAQQQTGEQEVDLQNWLNKCTIVNAQGLTVKGRTSDSEDELEDDINTSSDDEEEEEDDEDDEEEEEEEEEDEDVMGMENQSEKSCSSSSEED